MGKYMIIPYILLGVMDVRYLKLSLIHKIGREKALHYLWRVILLQ